MNDPNSNPTEKKNNKNFSIQKFFQHLRILSSSSKILLGILVIIMMLTLFWGFTVWIPIEARGLGVTISKNGLFQIMAQTEGTVLFFHVKTGQKVKKGDLIVELFNPQNKIKMLSSKSKLDNLQNEYKRLNAQINLEEEAVKKAIKREIQANEYAMEQIQKEIKSLTYELDLRKRFEEKGLISYALVQQTESALIQQEIDIEALVEKLATLNADLAKGYRTTELQNKEREVSNEEKEFSILVTEIQNEKIYSPYDGTITSILSDEGKLVKTGTPLLLIEEKSDNLDSFVIYGYFSIETGKDIIKGTPVEIEFPHLKEYEYGKMLGVVKSISDYAASPEHLLNTIYNKELIASLLSGNTAALEVVVSPLRNPKNPKEYLWNTGTSPSLDIRTGTLCVVFATVEEKKPIYFIFPFSSMKRRPHINLETAVQDDEVMQDFELVSLSMGVDHSQKVKATPVGSDYSSKDCVNLSSSTAVFRINQTQETMK